MKPEASRRIRTEICKPENKRQGRVTWGKKAMEKISETASWFIEKTYRIEKLNRTKNKRRLKLTKLKTKGTYMQFAELKEM